MSPRFSPAPSSAQTLSCCVSLDGDDGGKSSAVTETSATGGVKSSVHHHKRPNRQLFGENIRLSTERRARTRSAAPLERETCVLVLADRPKSSIFHQQVTAKKYSRNKVTPVGGHPRPHGGAARARVAWGPRKQPLCPAVRRPAATVKHGLIAVPSSLSQL